MSYEGFEQHICENGHYFEVDAMQAFMGGDVLCHCGAKSAWENPVDETNCEGMGYIPYEVLRKNFIVKERSVCKCPTCGNEHALDEDVFRVPTREETNPLRTIRNPSNPDDVRVIEACPPNFDW